MKELIFLNLFRKEKLDTKTILKFAIGTCRGMVHLAAEGVVHRDLACRNLLLDELLRVKITDFGLARVLDDTSAGQTQSTVGPIKWMAPESIIHRKYSTKSDVWSFGICLIEMCLSSEPYPGEDQMKVAMSVCKGIYSRKKIILKGVESVNCFYFRTKNTHRSNARRSTNGNHVNHSRLYFI